MTADELVSEALTARGRSYSPYSGYAVGAALLTEGGKVFHGTNVENASYGLTICAERSAVVRAVSEGYREFEAIAVATKDGGSLCGACRQFLREFGNGIVVHLADAKGRYRSTNVAELLPDGFSGENLQ